jgi:hypothetical protein
VNSLHFFLPKLLARPAVLKTSCAFHCSMDVISDYNPEDAAGFIRINALR